MTRVTSRGGTAPAAPPKPIIADDPGEGVPPVVRISALTYSILRKLKCATVADARVHPGFLTRVSFTDDQWELLSSDLGKVISDWIRCPATERGAKRLVSQCPECGRIQFYGVAPAANVCELKLGCEGKPIRTPITAAACAAAAAGPSWDAGMSPERRDLLLSLGEEPGVEGALEPLPASDESAPQPAPAPEPEPAPDTESAPEPQPQPEPDPAAVVAEPTPAPVPAPAPGGVPEPTPTPASPSVQSDEDEEDGVPVCRWLNIDSWFTPKPEPEPVVATSEYWSDGTPIGEEPDPWAPPEPDPWEAPEPNPVAVSLAGGTLARATNPDQVVAVAQIIDTATELLTQLQHVMAPVTNLVTALTTLTTRQQTDGPPLPCEPDAQSTADSPPPAPPQYSQTPPTSPPPTSSRSPQTGQAPPHQPE